jgi:phosphoglycerate kinase
MKYVSDLELYNLKNKRVILRADLNVPFKNGIIADDYRLKEILPTINLIIQKGGSITLITHIGRPAHKDDNLSTRLLLDWFINKNYDIVWAASIEEAYYLAQKNTHSIILLENVRFYAQEKTADFSFARKLSSLGDFYVNDAFGALHRNDTSIALLPTFFNKSHKTIGLLVQKELNTLTRLITKPKKPFVLILGGGKVQDKLPIIQNLLKNASTILLCPAIAATFLKALGKPVGLSLTDDTHIEACRKIIEDASALNVSIIFPQDYLIAHKTLEGNLSYVCSEKFPEDGIALSIGPQTTTLYSAIAKKAHTIFFNAAMGFSHIPESTKATQLLLQAIACSPGLSVVGGGDSVAAAQQANVARDITFLSTGGGATLAFLGGKKLPGLAAIAEDVDINK